MKNNRQTKTQLMQPLVIKTRKPLKLRKPRISDGIYILLSTLIIIGFADNVDRFIRNTVTPAVVDAQTRVDLAKKALLNEPFIVSPVSEPLIQKVEAAEVKNPFNPKSPKGIAWEVNNEMFGLEHWGALEELITNESGWNPFAINSSSGACGLGQALPCQKMNCENWDYECQVRWTATYIKDRYDTPTNAWNHWQSRVPIDGEDVGNWY